MRNFLLFVFLAFSAELFASQLSGLVRWAPNSEVKIEKYNEYFLNSVSNVTITNTNDTGFFNLTFEVERVGRYRVLINEYVAELYLEPNADFIIELRSYNGANLPVLSKEKVVGVKLLKDGESNLNTLIEEYNKTIDQFIQDNAGLIIQKRAGDVVKVFKQKTYEKLRLEQNEFVIQYVTYALAQLELTTNYSRQNMLEEFLVGKEVLFYNPEFARFYKDFFNGFFRFFATSKLDTKLGASINVHQNLDSLYSVLNTNKYFKQLSEEQKELLIITELYYQIESKKYKKQSIENILAELLTSTNFETHKVLLSEIQLKFTKLEVFSEAPNFEFKTLNGETKSLQDFRGKYVYLDFWASWCKPCIEEMIIMNELYEKYNQNIEFVSISIDKSITRAERFLKKKEYPWVFGHTNLSNIKEMYDVRIIPMYYLIGPEGELLQSPALRPTGGIERQFYKIKQLYKEQNTRDLPSWKIKPKSIND
jgi:thiol-disulfide isomerase/thioredoxin